MVIRVYGAKASGKLMTSLLPIVAVHKMHVVCYKNMAAHIQNPLYVFSAGVISTALVTYNIFTA